MHSLVEEAYQEKARHGDAMAHIADKRLLLLVDEWAKRFPKRGLRIQFGNGGNWIETEGCAIGLDGDAEVWLCRTASTFSAGRRVQHLDFLRDAVYDVQEITDGYRLACPNDVNWSPPLV